MLYSLEPQLQPLLGGYEAFENLMQMKGEAFRQEQGRETLRVQIGHDHYFLKRHTGVGWGEILKNLVCLRWPVLGAANEWQAIQRLQEIGVPTLTLSGYGQRGWNPARLDSFVLTGELRNTISLEDLYGASPALGKLNGKQRLQLKRSLLAELAEISRKLHTHGCNHRDFYLCHFHLDLTSLDEPAPRLYLIDLHRVQLRRRTPRRWIGKDLAGLYFSALDAGLTRNDCLRFIKAYGNRSLRDELSARGGFWRKVSRQARELYHKAHQRWPSMPNARLGL